MRRQPRRARRRAPGRSGASRGRPPPPARLEARQHGVGELALVLCEPPRQGTEAAVNRDAVEHLVEQDVAPCAAEEGTHGGRELVAGGPLTGGFVPECARDRPRAVAEDRAREIALAAPVAVERALGHASARRDVAHRGPPEPALHEELERGPLDVRPLVSNHSLTALTGAAFGCQRRARPFRASVARSCASSAGEHSTPFALSGLL